MSIILRNKIADLYKKEIMKRFPSVWYVGDEYALDFSTQVLALVFQECELIENSLTYPIEPYQLEITFI